MNRVIVYSKPDCHLCDLAKKVIERVRQAHPFELEIRNIEDNAEDFERYKIAIPVIEVNGKEIARYRVGERELIDALTLLP